MGLPRPHLVIARPLIKKRVDAFLGLSAVLKIFGIAGEGKLETGRIPCIVYKISLTAVAVLNRFCCEYPVNTLPQYYLRPSLRSKL